MALASIVPLVRQQPAAVDFGAAFPSVDLVASAAGLFVRHQEPLRGAGVVLGGPLAGHQVTASVRKSLELLPDLAARTVLDRMMVEGPRWRVTVTPGTVAIRRSDPVRAVRAYERAERARVAAVDQLRRDLLAGRETAPDGVSRIRSWSSRSRSRMVEVLGTLDYSPFFATGEAPAMVTLTYPGDWLAVASDAAESRRHLLLFRKRFERAWGRRLLAVWKREFQRRGAPHFHLLMVPPTGTVNGQSFPQWLSSTWASIVGASTECRCDAPAEHDGRLCWDSERARHLLAGTGVDYRAGLEASNPALVGVYFSKHGSFSGKDYQNVAPDEWTGSVGRFWGVWGLAPVRASVEVAPAEGLAIARTLRRHSRSQGRTARVPVWRYRTVVDQESGEIRAKWRKSTALRRSYRLQQSAGYLVHADAPALASSIAVHLDRLRRPDQVMSRSGAGPVGFLP